MLDIGIGFLIGFVVGYLLKKALKLAIIIMIAAFLLQLNLFKEFMSVNVNMEKGKQIVGGVSVYSASFIEELKAFLSMHTPFAVSILTGMAFGFLRS